MEKVGQPLMGDRRYICLYEGSEHVPYVLNKPLTFVDDIWPYQDSDKRVTFAVKVPLVHVVGGPAVIAQYIEQTYLPDGVLLENYQLRAIGSTFESFDQTLNGAVHLQVVCQMKGPV